MSINKYYAGTPFYRQGSLQHILGVPITASSIFDQTEYVTNAIFPVLKHLRILAGNAKHYYIDDTTHRILDQTAIIKKQRNSDKQELEDAVTITHYMLSKSWLNIDPYACILCGSKVRLTRAISGLSGEERLANADAIARMRCVL